MAGNKGPLFWIGIGCAVTFAGFVAFFAFILLVVFGAMRSSTPYQEAMERVRNDPRVAAALGTPVDAGWFVTGQIKTSGEGGTADIGFSVSGPRGKARVRVQAWKSGGRWVYVKMMVTPENGPPIDLLARPSTRESRRTASRAA